ncbi:MAG: glutamine-hydrolyzing GMP synthase [Candidatus Thermoplasmatota archaeon]|jgi:GMP synthase (glutamine-hydrolysing)|nr:glutamine-hydrolyzing GMP synthase [Candidatus Sysuiplasma jiujiangense]MBX8639374.1 glutamine-hydrolyzing GMP synthase [Candidatus Sysuiplasma jiujiangense]MBX8642731.1 glutamine-hydrolyzing GMP synthase [Candidatus Sysuiplasma jiujiangense]MCL4316693.1 glutamine-hydrolyzing GMP synthase [Candidatus Thermoplasmatota archaeon]
MNAEDFIESQITKLSGEIKGRAVIALSGGIDSTVAAVLTNRAIGERLLCIYVDTGFMRKGETENVTTLFYSLELNFKIVNAEGKFLKLLENVTDPEMKRQIIGRKFIEIFEEEAKLFGAEWLVQGTIAPDWIESGDSLRDRIKSHHNVGGLPEGMRLRLVEPLRDLYKDEVRSVARCLGIGSVDRQPFPGPGLAVRILGPINTHRVNIEREACAIVEEELEKAHSEGMIGELPWQYFAVLLPVRSVGVQGDERAYGETVVVRAVRSTDAMTARFSDIPHEVLENISTRITNTLGSDVTRVVFDITNKPPATIEWE